MIYILGNILEPLETPLLEIFILKCNGGPVTKEWNSARGTEITTTTKGTVRKRISPAGGLTGLMFHKHDCNGIDDIWLVGINNVCRSVGLLCNTGIIK